jgi:hypothetical protein
VGSADGGEASADDGSPPDATETGSADTGSNDSTTSDGDASTGDTGPGFDASTDGTESGLTNDGGGDAGGFPDAGPDCGIGTSGEPLDLACTGLYSDWPSKTVAAGNQEFAPGYVLWSDGAIKQRWISVPPGTQIDTSTMDEWTFPVNTRIWKEFSLVLTDGGAPTRIETRLLWKQAVGTWYRTTYRWSADGQTSATELTTGQQNVAGTTYEIPNQFMCTDCHSGSRDGVMGFEAIALAAPAATGLTLAQLQAEGLITNAPSGSLAVPGDPTSVAALGWLHMNCGVPCHNTNGMASGTGFLMRLNVANLSSVQVTSAYTTGWNHVTNAFTIPDAGTTYRFHACDVPESAAYYRASRRAGINGTLPGVQMPPEDTHAIDVVDVAALAAWINDGCDAGLPSDAGGQ